MEANTIKKEKLIAQMQEGNDWLGNSVAKQHPGGW